MSIGTRIHAELRGDRVIWMIVFLLAIFSVMIVYSASSSLAFRAKGGNIQYYLVKQVLIVGFGIMLTYLAFLMHYQRYNKWAPWLLIFSIPLLVYTFSSGVDLNSAKRWIVVPYVGITFQTSDFAKLALILFVAHEITKKQEYIKDLKTAFLPIIVPILIICGLIAPSDLSTALILFLTTMLMMFIGRVNWKYIGLLFLLGLVVFATLIILGEFYPDVIRVDTWVTRVRNFVSGDSGYQVEQAKIAIANGGWFGLGPGNSVQRNYLPAPYSDFIYAIIWEEYGLLGGFTVLGIYVLLFFRVVKLVTRSPKAFGAMAAVGLTLVLVIQALANMAVVVDLVPVTGLNLPMLSMGGTSILFSSVSFGIILSISKYVETLSQE